MIEDNVNAPIGVFTFKLGDDMFNKGVVDFIRVIVRVIKKNDEYVYRPSQVE